MFGGRLAELLIDITELEILICGRNGEKAEAFCQQHQNGQARLIPLVLDREKIATALSRHSPDLVVDASGPFQDYGDDSYGVIKACISAKVDYMDFADGAEFVFGVSSFDDQAKKAGIYVLSGVSSFPVLTAAVLRKLSDGMAVLHVKGGIAPSPYAGIGLNVMRAVLSMRVRMLHSTAMEKRIKP